ncbi:MAG TPA: response regulator [Candidatus Nitrosocosmicus sp.]
MSSSSSSQPQDIIVVDDELDLAFLYKQFITGLGFHVVSFTDSLLAFEHFRQNIDRYCLLITDLRMPGMNGIELANKIREVNKTVKIFLVTAFATEDLENRQDFKEAKVDRIIQKPLKFSKLKEIIKQDIKIHHT